PEPYPFFVSQLAGSTAIGGGFATRGGFQNFGGAYAPAHYLKQFLPKYSSEEAVTKKAKDLGFDSWVSLLKNRYSWALNNELPVMTPWKTVSPINTPTWSMERNPYFWAVDTAGNQLPYIDRITMTLAENTEVANLRAIAGEYDIQERHMGLAKLPVFLENAKKGNYTVHLDPALDVKQANELLDKVGLSKKDGEGYRLRTDGKGRLRLELVTVGGQFVPYTPVGEMIKQQWKRIGIDLDVKELERNLAFTRDNGSENQMITWANDGSEMIYLFPRHALPVDAAEAHMGMAYAKWYASRGAAGKKPEDPEMLRAFDLFREAFGASEENRVKNAKEIWRIAVEQIWSI